MDLSFYFKKWKRFSLLSRYDWWCDIHNEELMEQNYAEQNKMDSVYWCWNCKHSDCDQHP
jgi:hypothetical protein